MTTVLLVWEDVPVSTKFFRLEGDEAEVAIAAHGLFLNATDDDDEIDKVDRLNCLLTDKEPLDATSPLDAAGYDRIVLAGFVL